MARLHGYQAAKDVLDPLRIPYRIEIGGKHAKVHFVVNGANRFVVVPITPSDRRRDYYNNRAVVRRILRAEGVAV